MFEVDHRAMYINRVEYYIALSYMFLSMSSLGLDADGRTINGIILVLYRAVETHFKKPRFFSFFKKPKNPEKLGF